MKKLNILMTISTLILGGLLAPVGHAATLLDFSIAATEVSTMEVDSDQVQGHDFPRELRPGDMKRGGKYKNLDLKPGESPSPPNVYKIMHVKSGDIALYEFYPDGVYRLIPTP